MYQQKVLKECHVCHKPIYGLYRAEHIEVGGVRKKIFIHGNHPKEKSEEQVKEKKERDEKLDKWYKKIYDMADGYCAESGRKLKFDKKFCAHLLPKNNGSGGFPYFKFDLRNGILLDWRYHGILDKGSATQRKALKTWEYISLQRKMLLEEVGMTYNEEFWLNMSV